MQVQEFFDQDTSTLTYCVYDPASRDAVVIDPVLNYDPVNCKIANSSFSQLHSFIQKQKLHLHAVLETHVHADHWTGAQLVKDQYPKVKTIIGTKIAYVFDNFTYLAADQFPPADQVFDQLVAEGDSLRFGTLQIDVLETPGHTPCCLTYKIGENLFVGDLIFMPDSGTGRCDFPGGDSKAMFHSVKQKIYQFPDHYVVYTCHDYQPEGRELRFRATVGEHKKSNVRLSEKVSEAEFVKFRTERDATLSLPKLIFSSLQINLLSGKLPSADAAGRRFLKIPYWQDSP